MSEQLLKISRMRFNSANSFDLKYYFSGDEFAHRHIKKKAGIPRVRPNEPPPKSSLSNKERINAWASLNNEERLLLPHKCPKCSPSEQQTFWRASTETSLNAILKNRGKGMWFNEEEVLTAEPSKKFVNSEKLENPGIIWISQNPDLALNVGLARGLTSQEPITLMGSNICKCDLDEGTKIISPIKTLMNGLSQIIVLDGSNIAEYPWASNGVIINEIPQKKFSESVFYQVNLKPFSRIQKAIQRSKLDLQTVNSDIFLRQLTDMLGSLLMFLALKDPEVPEHFQIDFLPRTFKLFLNQISKEEVGSF